MNCVFIQSKAIPNSFNQHNGGYNAQYKHKLVDDVHISTCLWSRSWVKCSRQSISDYDCWGDSFPPVSTSRGQHHGYTDEDVQGVSVNSHA